MPSTELDALSSKVVAVKARWPIYSEIADWLVSLITDTIHAQDRLPLPEIKLDLDQINQNLAKGVSVYQPEDLPVDLDSVLGMCARLAEKVAVRQGQGAARLTELLNGSAEPISELIKALVRSDHDRLTAVAEHCRASQDALKLMLKLALRPSLRRLSEAVVAQVDLSRWRYGHCPVCGSAPLVAELAKETGARRLHCGLCETAWAYPRLRCPFCENEDTDQLSYTCTKEDRGLRLDTCARCGQSLKCVDLRHAPGPVIPLLDDLITTHLVYTLTGMEVDQSQC
ncbi:MAG: formate dehydrogenase accessory protein FdhE [Deltaproteobacteria bacterium]|nr:formate dehydrogenase accessory protein FdhE [Deltaproteobacteria bacterium]